jgi:uncharacterized paraquat-inducible protein A
MEFILFFVVFVVIACIWLVNFLNKEGEYEKLPTFDQYKEHHTELVNRGRVECHQCGGTKMHTRGLDDANDKRKTHFCTTCGTPLYRSQH